VFDAVNDAVHPAGAFAARRALATGFLEIEIREPLQRAHHADGFVHDDDGTRAQHRTGLGDGVVVHGAVHHDVRRQHRRRRAAGNHGLELVAAAHPAGHFQQL